ncbi:DUF5807 family protein [Halegenticoccus tardaugens]|uniref:DUF5807 family protein n=1 Tax=Halegenticoccus tardaugens TaxID=2071624 RepID=UPI00100BDBDF|nr:DUF5807 family protein [Halegenticoccus tardaugens]
MSKLEAFLAGDRPDDVALFLTHDYLDEQGKIANYGEDVPGGVVLVVPGDEGRRMFAAGTGTDAMRFAGGAMGTEGEIDPDLDGGACPDAEPGEDHSARFVFAFAEERNEEVGGIYAEGDVIHAYAQCECGVAYSDRWVAGAR